MSTTINPIHGIVLRRLAAAWIILSLIFGGAAYFYQIKKIDDFVLALATSESQRLHALGIPLDKFDDMATQRALQAKAREFAHENFVIVEIYDRERRILAEAVNPAHTVLEESLKKRRHTFPQDDDSHYERMTINGTTLVQVLVPLRGEKEGGNPAQTVGYFEGVFIVSPEIIERLRNDLVRALTITLFAVLLTTIVFYPVILSLNRRVLDFSREVIVGNLEMATVLGAAIAKRDSDTNAHNFRVTLYAIALGESLGLDAAAMRALIFGAFLHDVGKIGISDNILLKPDRLTETEYEVMRKHVELGLDILHEAHWLHSAREVVGNHHEKFDGSGYPQGLSGEAIPLGARIFAIVDVFDALISTRPYKQAISMDDTLAMLRKDAGTHFDPAIFSRFEPMAGELYKRYANAAEPELRRALREKGLRYFFAESGLKTD